MSFEVFEPKNDEERRIEEDILEKFPKIDETKANALVKNILEKKGYWVQKTVNLSKILRKSLEKKEYTGYFSPTQLLMEIKHPLQPDIDILYCRKLNDKKVTPLYALEIKVFTQLKGKIFMDGKKIGKVIPRSGISGFYAGLGQALIYTHYGIDFVNLCNIVILPYHEWFKEDLTETQIDTLINEHAEWCSAYNQILKGTLENFNLPIGIIQFAFSVDKEENEIRYADFTVKKPGFIILVPVGAKIRSYLLEQYEIEDKIYKKDWLEDLILSYS